MTHKTYFYKPGKRFHILQGTQPLPPVILLHGGAWFRGNPSHMLPMAQHLNRLGFTVVIPQYSLGAVHWNMKQVIVWILIFYLAVLFIQWQVVLCFILIYSIVTLIHGWRWQETMIEPLMDIKDLMHFLNYNRVVLIGHSAGAHLAALYANLSKADVCEVIGISGVYSDQHIMNTKIGRLLAHNLRFMKQPYPIYHVERATPRQWLIINCELDSGLKRDSYDFATALIESGHRVQVKYLRHSNHITCINSVETFNIITTWLEAIFKPTQSS